MQLLTYEVDRDLVKLFLNQLKNVANVAHVDLTNQQLSSHTLSDMPINQSSHNSMLDMMDRTIEARDMISKVYEALSYMNDTQNRDVIKFKYLYQWTHREISERLTISESYVAKLLKTKALDDFALAYGMFE